MYSAVHRTTSVFSRTVQALIPTLMTLVTIMKFFAMFVIVSGLIGLAYIRNIVTPRLARLRSRFGFETSNEA